MSLCRGAPDTGGPTPDQQRQQQGSIWLGHGEILAAPDAARGSFLSGGVWVSIGCFSAGTPARSRYIDWLRHSRAGNGGIAVDRLEHSLPPPGQRPFISALAKTALANPSGPLAVFGHIDLAWLYGFIDLSDPRRTRADHFYRLAEQLCRGRRFGIAVEDFQRARRALDGELLDREVKAWDRLRRPAPDRARSRLRVALTREDLRGYVLLGDPASRVTELDSASAR